jgi:serine/threonine-protein kinase RsbW
MRVKSSPDAEFCLVFQCETLSVPVMRRVLGDTLRGLGVDEESVYDILLAATEACTNVLAHGGQQVSSYAVLTSLGAIGCQVEVTDEGAGLSAAEVRELTAPSEPGGAAPGGLAPGGAAPGGLAPGGPAPGGPAPGGPLPELPVAQLAESGRGLAVMRACVDNVTLDSRPGRGTVVTIRKHISWSSDAPLRHFEAAS